MLIKYNPHQQVLPDSMTNGKRTIREKSNASR